ncbi:hypothetical protein BC828DRAFT_403013 [Blastocladiella britannica]|nr:hypothetical protein BC828DRAFT_403013 [Blastocladiella britannica]
MQALSNWPPQPTTTTEASTAAATMTTMATSGPPTSTATPPPPPPPLALAAARAQDQSHRRALSHASSERQRSNYGNAFDSRSALSGKFASVASAYSPSSSSPPTATARDLFGSGATGESVSRNASAHLLHSPAAILDTIGMDAVERGGGCGCDDDETDAITVQVKYIPIAGSIAFFALVGALARIALSGGIAIFETHPQPTITVGLPSDATDAFGAYAIPWGQLASLFLPQIAGSAVMGWAVHGKEYLMRIYLPLYFGLTTGLCGSLTSFSTVIAVSATPLTGSRLAYQSAYSYFISLMLLSSALSLSYVSLLLGTHIGSLVRGFGLPTPHPALPLPPLALTAPRLRAKLSRRDAFTVTLGSTVWLVVIGIAVWRWLPPTRTAAGSDPRWTDAALALAVAPPGALLRYALSVAWGRRGTLVANWMAVLVLTLLKVAGHQWGGEWTEAGTSVILGFCGALSTVSTFVNELSTMPPRDAAGYVLVSSLPSLAVAVVGMGLPVYLTQ